MALLSHNGITLQNPGIPEDLSSEGHNEINQLNLLGETGIK